MRCALVVENSMACHIGQMAGRVIEIIVIQRR